MDRHARGDMDLQAGKASGTAGAAPVFTGAGLSGRGGDQLDSAAVALREPGTTTTRAAACRDRAGADIRAMAGGDARQDWRLPPPGSHWRLLEQEL